MVFIIIYSMDNRRKLGGLQHFVLFLRNSKIKNSITQQTLNLIFLFFFKQTDGDWLMSRVTMMMSNAIYQLNIFHLFS